MSESPVYILPTRALLDTQTIRSALDVLIEEHSAGLPVTDGSGKLLGFLSTYRIIGLLLPRAMTDSHLGLRDLSFIANSLGHVQEKMEEIGGERVGDYMESIDHVVHPDTPVTEVMLLLYRAENRLPVADRETGHLLGLVSATRLLEAIAGKS